MWSLWWKKLQRITKVIRFNLLGTMNILLRCLSSGGQIHCPLSNGAGVTNKNTFVVITIKSLCSHPRKLVPRKASLALIAPFLKNFPDRL